MTKILKIFEIPEVQIRSQIFSYCLICVFFFSLFVNLCLQDFASPSSPIMTFLSRKKSYFSIKITLESHQHIFKRKIEKEDTFYTNINLHCFSWLNLSVYKTRILVKTLLINAFFWPFLAVFWTWGVASKAIFGFYMFFRSFLGNLIYGLWLIS